MWQVCGRLCIPDRAVCGFLIWQVQKQREKWRENAKLALMDEKSYKSYSGKATEDGGALIDSHRICVANFVSRTVMVAARRDATPRPTHGSVSRLRVRHPQVPQVQEHEDGVRRGTDALCRRAHHQKMHVQ